MSGEIRAGGQPPTEPTSKVVFAIVIVMIAGVVLYFTLGMPGMDHGAPSHCEHDMSNMTVSPSGRWSVGPAESQSLMAEPNAFVINVHVRYDGEIIGTGRSRLQRPVRDARGRSQSLRARSCTGVR